MRGAEAEVRTLTFQAGGISLELQLEHGRAGITLRGLVGGAEAVLVEESARQVSAAVDEDGWFSVPGLAGGATRVRVRAAGGRSVSTPWIWF
jgi:hypothetical protein